MCVCVCVCVCVSPAHPAGTPDNPALLNTDSCVGDGIPCEDFMYLISTCRPGHSYRRRFRSLWLCVQVTDVGLGIKLL